MKKLMIVAMLAKIALCDLLISGVMYDPAGADTGKEWVEIYNPGTEDIMLDSLEFQTGNGNSPDDWQTGYSGTPQDIIRAGEHLVIGEADVLPTPDRTATLDLQNGPDACRIVLENATLDTVGWGELEFPEYFEGQPHEDASDGLALVRDSQDGAYIDTGNNSHDFNAQEALPSPGGTSNVDITLDVKGESIRILSCSVLDENQAMEGVQVYPLPGRDREIPFQCRVTVDGGCSALTTEPAMDNTSGSGNSCNLTGSLDIGYTQHPGNQALNVTFFTNSSSNQTSISYEVMPVNALHLDLKDISYQMKRGETLILAGDYDMYSQESPSIQNIGNTVIDLAAIVTDFTASTGQYSPSIMEYLLTDQERNIHSGNFLPDLNEIDIGLAPGSIANLTLSINMPQEATAGEYNARASFFSVVS